MSLDEYLRYWKKPVREVIEECKTSPLTVIARYTAAIAGNFQMWLGFTTPQHPYSKWVVDDNLYLEKQENHADMLRDFARSCHARPDGEHFDHIESNVKDINKMFQSWPERCGACGLGLIAALEEMSKIFIPDLAKRAKECGCDDFTYTEKHGEADAAHADAFRQALAKESKIMNGFVLRDCAKEGRRNARRLIRMIYMPDQVN